MVNFNDEPREDSVDFFEKILSQHSMIASFKKTENFVYRLNLINNNSYLVRLTNKYSVSLSDIVEGINEGFDAIVTISSWNDYTYDAKEYALQHDFGLFKIREFMGALNFSNPSQYYTRIDEEDGMKLYGENGYKFDF